MRIAMFTNNYLPRISGPAHAIETLKNGLEKLGHSLFVFAPKYHKSTVSSEKVIRVSSIRIPHNVFYPVPLPFFSNIERIFKSLKIDIVHSHHPIMLGQTAFKLAKKFNLPIIYSLHSQWDLYIYKFLPFFPFNYITKVFESISNNYAAKVDAVTVPNKIFKKKFQSKINQKNIFIIPSAINHQLFFTKIKNAKVNLRKHLKLPQQSKIIFCVTRLSFEKNIDFLIKSVSPLLMNNKENYLVIVGDGVAKLWIKNLVRSLNLNNKVILMGSVPHNQLPLLYQGSDVFAFSSDFETQCLAINEAMASGLIVVAKKADYLKTVIQNEKNGYLSESNFSDFSKKIELALQKNKKNQQIVANAKKSARCFSDRIICRKMEALYQSLVKK